MSVIQEVWLVKGHIEYEGFDIIAVCESESVARLIQQHWKNKKRTYDDLSISKYPLITKMNLLMGIQQIR